MYILSICEGNKVCAYKINKNISLNCINAKPNWRLRKIAAFSFFKLIKYLNKNSIDIVFMIGHYVPSIAFLIKPFVRCKFIFCDHGAIENQLKDKKALLEDYKRKLSTYHYDNEGILKSLDAIFNGGRKDV